MARELKKSERAALNRIEKALADPALGKLALFFNEGGVSVFDKEDWNADRCRGGAVQQDEMALTYLSIGCRYDTGAI